MKLPAATRKQFILDAAIRVANRDGLLCVNPKLVALECGISTAPRTVRAYFPRIAELWSAIYEAPEFVGDDMGFRPNERA